MFVNVCKHDEPALTKITSNTWRFPKDKDLRKNWEVALRREGFTASDDSVVYRQHFKQVDFWLLLFLWYFKGLLLIWIIELNCLSNCVHYLIFFTFTLPAYTTFIHINCNLVTLAFIFIWKNSPFMKRFKKDCFSLYFKFHSFRSDHFPVSIPTCKLQSIQSIHPSQINIPSADLYEDALSF